MPLRAYRDGTDPKDGAGWLRTGDAGAWDAEARRLRVFGRVGDLVITGGENVWPVAVERVLARHPAVAEVAVVGRPTPSGGQRVVAVVVPAAGADPRPRRAARRHQGRAPRLRRLPRAGARRVAPRTPLGKVACARG